MKDERIVKLAHNLVNYSVAAKKGDKVLIEAFDVPYPLVTELIKAVYAAGAQAFVTNIDTRVRAQLLKGATDEQLTLWSKLDAAVMSEMDCYIGLRGSDNAYENAGVPSERMDKFMSITKSALKKRAGLFCAILRRRWRSLRACQPNSSRITILMYATSTIPKWTKPWTRSPRS